MTEDQLETWMHNMIRACNRSTYDSDINVLKLIQHIENLYEKGRADEREQADLAEQWDTSDMAHRSGGLSVEQAEKQEPVAWLEPEWGEKICPEVGYEATMTEDHPRDLCWIPLYTAPTKREWVGLTEDESDDIYNAHHNTYGECITSAYDLVFDIEAKLKEKNT
jgi:hypothetical protein